MSVKERLLEAGVTLLREQGIAALTQPRIARQAGVSQSHLTYYFPTRNVLLLAIAEHSIAQDLAQSQQHLENLPPTLEHFSQALAYLPRIRMMLGLMVAADQDPALREALGLFVQRLRQTLTGLLSRNGQPPAPARVLLLHATLVGLACLNLAQQSDQSRQDIDTALGTLLPLLSTPLQP
ncbi:TetR/AcrR family transcriptional regulator [Azospira inquinata]|uniref:TetR/AcrR family transcriptional regulator n=1 Tax=Azospira inquinata TaxID=2785627 RepID=A0A975SMM8_9RHOO|nr:TetR/AcrR family transcriptional regulator [Azospira inquinata]QWT45993.1 TetR/AcrR family transcriptional regulator [Azospira inquinata]QWT48680.1 TetR/AcrR family transcriptional regulator [Azospira inquinata]